MNGINPSPSNRLSAAENRLAQALERLDKAMSNRAARGDVDSPIDADLNAQLQSLQSENSNLRSLVDATAERLDGTIAKFKSQLAG